jgi:glycosyltransferase involved in cell wall biosynthesis
MGSPSLSVIIPTRNRAEHAALCVRSILASPGFQEVIVVDQSDGPETQAAIEALGDARVRNVRSTMRGATNGRNQGIELSTGTVVAFTDDDCRVAPDWASEILAVFANDPDTVVVCGRVMVPEALKHKGFTTAFEPAVREWQGRFPPPESDWGITANFAVRREVFTQVSPFDGRLGPGAPLGCGEEIDFLFRVLKAGFKVVNAREVAVDHLGVRAHGEESRDLWRLYAKGTAAALFKHVRLGDPDAMKLCLRHLAGCARMIFINAVHLHRPIGIGYATAFLSGVVASFKFNVDRQSRLYY